MSVAMSASWEFVGVDRKRAKVEMLLSDLMEEVGICFDGCEGERRLWLDVLMSGLREVHVGRRDVRRDAQRWLLDDDDSTPGALNWIANILGITCVERVIGHVLAVDRKLLKEFIRATKKVKDD
ncbi:hypothetical protein CCP3SC15_4030002 [Gammaproteobacteria bacterium]